MPLIDPHAAAYRLASKWGIPHPVAEQIVKGVLYGGHCFVVGRRLGEPLQDVSKAVAAAMSSAYMPSTSMIPWDFTDVKMDWNDLLEHGRKLVPPMWEQFISAAEDGLADEPALTSRDEHEAVAFLAKHLKLNPAMKRDDAWRSFGARFPTLSKKGFLERVWPQARQAAGLKAAAPPGPKPKQIIRRA
jgi:hypothetical protein